MDIGVGESKRNPFDELSALDCFKQVVLTLPSLRPSEIHLALYWPAAGV